MGLDYPPPRRANGLRRRAGGNDCEVPVVEQVRVPLPTTFGPFEARAFECEGGNVYLALVKGDVSDGKPALARVHSECLTGDVLGSLRCDCGVQLRTALKAIAAAGRGVLIYATGHEGRGIGLVNKLRAYMEQDLGADTIDANLHLGLPIDDRDYADAADVLRMLGLTRVELMTNNPRKIEELRTHGIEVHEVVPLAVAPHFRNNKYLATKRDRMGHNGALSAVQSLLPQNAPDVGDLMGEVRPQRHRPYVVMKYAQSLDGRIATATGDSKWISGEAERVVSHSIRARCDAVMVGIGTIIADDPQLTVRLVPGSSPIRVVLDSHLRIPRSAGVLNDDARTIILTGPRSSPAKRRALLRKGVDVQTLPERGGRVDIRRALQWLRHAGVTSLLVEGGAQVITSLLDAGSLVDRLIVSVAPRVLGEGTEGVGDLGVVDVASGLFLENRTVHIVGQDVIMAGTVASTGNRFDRMTNERMLAREAR
jgi:GTP cyclohydrolase II